ncbi:hypothetical protein [Rathayibacter sp. VKM Ac-2857]|uniref:hypothetical protein n=1 Tax=Rathayibacter sp. VKM Ac-2857 TaxID=2739020 RepID=UPI0015634A79|nr:hypothetical protein [Rathayibacter sp. VKM Ac-2857]NQX16848.1 hypothetical protein [Rathayibacter sp. VKM Ac-2857]
MNEEEKEVAAEKQKPLSIMKKLLAGAGAAVIFGLGAFLGPAIGDFYTWVKEQLIGRTITSTEVRQLNVVDYNGALRTGYEISETASGSCGAESMRLVGQNAYRCAFDSQLADPCLARDEGLSVFCLSDPWTMSGVLIELDTPVTRDPSQTEDASGTPWALQVADPRDDRTTWRCLSSEGNATSEVSGNRSSWSCVTQDGSGMAHALNDVIKNDAGPWRVLFSDETAPDIIEADIVTAWF